MIKLDSISPSKIKTYKMCKFKFWLTYIAKMQLKSNYGAASGTLIHHILEEYVDKSNLDWVNQLFSGFEGVLTEIGRDGKPKKIDSPLKWAKAKEYQEQIPRCDICSFRDEKNNICSINKQSLDKLTGCPKYLFQDSLSVLEKTIKRYETIWPKVLKKDNNIIGTEYEFKIKLDGTDVPLIGIMDLVIEEDRDTLHIIDYKAGQTTQDFIECKNDIQVKAYSMACRREFIEDINNKGYKYKNVYLTFDYFRGKPVTIAFSKEDDLKTEKEIVMIVKDIESTDWINRIVKSSEEFLDRKRTWKCHALCDTVVCKTNWKGDFKI